MDFGAGVRAGQYLIQAGKAFAAMDGRFSVAIDDVRKAAEPVLRLVNPHWQNGVFTVTVPTLAGKSYALQYKTTLFDITWTSLPAVTGNGSILTLTDSTASSTQRFYRVSEQ